MSQKLEKWFFTKREKNKKMNQHPLLDLLGWQIVKWNLHRWAHAISLSETTNLNCSFKNCELSTAQLLFPSVSSLNRNTFFTFLFLNSFTGVKLNCFNLQTYYIVKPFVYPMVDKIGVLGCGFIMLILDIFARLYSYHLPISISALRYIFIVKNQVFSYRLKNNLLPWSSGYGRRLMFQRSQVQIPAPYTG